MYSSSNSAVLVFEVVVSVLLVSLQVEHAAVQGTVSSIKCKSKIRTGDELRETSND